MCFEKDTRLRSPRHAEKAWKIRSENKSVPQRRNGFTFLRMKHGAVPNSPIGIPAARPRCCMPPQCAGELEIVDSVSTNGVGPFRSQDVVVGGRPQFARNGYPLPISRGANGNFAAWLGKGEQFFRRTKRTIPVRVCSPSPRRGRGKNGAAGGRGVEN